MSHPNRPRWTTERRSGAPTGKQNYQRPNAEGDADDDDSDDEMPGAYAITSNFQRPPVQELERQQSHCSVQEESQQVSRIPSVFHDEPDDSLPSSRAGGEGRASGEENDDRLYATSRFISSEEDDFKKQGKKSQWCRNKWFIAICTLCFIAVALFAAIYLFRGKNEVAHDTDEKLSPYEAKDIDIRDPFVQCETQPEISIISDRVQEAYKSLKALAPLQSFLPRGLDITSCRDPANLALVWLALEVQDGYDWGLESLVNRYALLVAYAAMGGSEWKEKAGWLTHAPECSWYGIKCDMNKQTIKSIKLSINNLEGNLESSLGLLTGLKKLNLSYNSISGSIPVELWNLRLLEDLLLGDNDLVGSLPSSLAEHASSLRRLSLPRNTISGALPLLTRMSHLVEFDLSETLLRGTFPTEGLDHLTSLEILNLEQLGQVSGTLPSSIASMTNLRKLYLMGTSTSGTIPESVGEMTSLEELVVGYLSGTIPTCFGNLANLTRLDIRGSRMVGTLPSELGRCTQLRLLEFSNTGIAGTLPSVLASLSNLERLYMTCTAITEPFPDGICGHFTTIFTDLNKPQGPANCDCCSPDMRPCQA